MKCILVTVLWLMICPYVSDANWCIQNTTTNTRVTKALTKIVTSRKWFGGIKRKTVRYVVTELVPRIRQHRVCCEGYKLDSVHRICEPNCPEGCPVFSSCVQPNTCECHVGHQMKGNSCEPICEPACGVNEFCLNWNLCICKSGFEYNDETRSCEPTEGSTTFHDFSVSTLTDFTTDRYVHSESTTFSIISEPTTTTEIPRMHFTESSTITESSTTESTWTSDDVDNYRRKNAHCSYTYKCDSESCRFVMDHCQCKAGFVRPHLACHLRYGYPLGVCIEVGLCGEPASKEFTTSTEQILSSELLETSTLTSVEFQQTSPDYRSRNAYCSYAYNCDSGSCRLVIDHCQCNEGFARVDLSCHFKYGYSLGECIASGLCREPNSEEFSESTEQSTSSESSESYTFDSTDSSSNCDYECLGGLCKNGLCQCAKGSVFSQKSSACIADTSCEAICHNGTCQENGLCECFQGFVYQFGNGCVPYCDRKCINGICAEPGKCKCHNGFTHRSDNLFECIPSEKLSKKLEKHDGGVGFPWIWVVSAILLVVICGLFIIIKKSRKHNYNVDKVENIQHVVMFDCKGPL